MGMLGRWEHVQNNRPRKTHRIHRNVDVGEFHPAATRPGKRTFTKTNWKDPP